MLWEKQAFDDSILAPTSVDFDVFLLYLLQQQCFCGNPVSPTMLSWLPFWLKCFDTNQFWLQGCDTTILD